MEERPSSALLGFLLLSITLNVMVVVKGLSLCSDFKAFYASAKLIGNSVHNLEDQRREQSRVCEGRVLEFHHPAFEALVFLPFTVLNYKVAAILWLCLNLLLLAAFTRLGTDRWFWSALFTFGFAPAAFCLVVGQDSILLLLICALSYSFSNSRPALAGAALAMGLFRFHIIMPIVLLMLVRGRWRFAIGFGVISIVLIALSTSLSDPMDYINLLLNINHTQAEFVLIPSSVPNLRGLAHFLTGSDISFLAAAIVLFSLVCYLSRNLETSRLLGVGLVFGLLTAWYIQSYDLTLLGLPLITRTDRPTKFIGGLVAFLPVYQLLGRFDLTALLALPITCLLLILILTPPLREDIQC